MLMLSELDIVLKLSLALLFSALVGVEREKTRHPAGLKTHMLVCIGSTMITMVSAQIFNSPVVAAGIVTGIGFLGAGTIFKDKDHVRGLTTAASIWTIAGVGLALGSGAYFLAGMATVAMLITFSLWRVEKLVRKS